MIRSLTFKWIAILLVTSLIGVILVGFFAYRKTVNEFDRLRLEQAEAAFVQDATDYYQSNHSWEGINSWLKTQETYNTPDQTDLPTQLCALADQSGTVIVGSG